MNILATLVYVQKDDKTLMILPGDHKHEYYQKKWNGLGGKLEPEEAPEECAKREVLEEAGIKPKKLKLVGILTFTKVDDINDWYIFVYVCREFEGGVKESKEGRLKWFETSELTKLNLWEGDYIFLPWITEGKFFSAKFVYKKGKLKSHDVVFY